MKWIKYFLMLSGAVIIFYGFIQDYDLITIFGVFLFVIGIMLRSIIQTISGKKK